MEESFRENNPRRAYTHLKQIRNTFKPRPALYRDKYNRIISNREGIKKYMGVYFQKLLNNAEQQAEHSEIPDPTEHKPFTKPPDINEVRKALTTLTNNKEPGRDELPTDRLTH